MTEWSVAFEVAGDDEAAPDVDAEQLWPLLDALAAHSPTVGGGGRRYDAQFNVEAADAGTAWAKALRLWRRAVATARLPAWPMVHAEILTAAEHDRILGQSPPELVGVSEIAAVLKTTRNRAWQVTKKPDFPRPMAELAAGPVWALPMVTRFIEEWPRRGGRRAGGMKGSTPPQLEPWAEEDLERIAPLLDDVTRNSRTDSRVPALPARRVRQAPEEVRRLLQGPLSFKDQSRTGQEPHNEPPS